MKGCIYLIPVTLGSEDPAYVIPSGVLEITKRLRFFIVENTRSSRRFLRMIDKSFPIDDTTFMELNEHTGEKEMAGYLEPLMEGHDVGIMSEAGLPGLADPGARIVSMAHSLNIRVVPLSGPSSIVLALISSGLNGQAFTFNGYLPVKPGERSLKIKEIEKRANEGYAQIFMETPYRNQKLFEAIIAECRNDRKLTVAADITLKTEYIRTLRISEWKSEKPDLNDRLVVFVLQ